MTFKPDYGLRQLRDGVSREVDQFFYSFRLYNLTILGRGHYSTMADAPLSGELHAFSLDFNQTQLERILLNGPREVVAQIRQELQRDPTTARTIELDGEVVFGVRARLGDIQKVQHEIFVPLVAQEII